MALPPGHHLSHYRLIDPIGEGGTGVVWRATHSTLRRNVSVKVLRLAFAHDPRLAPVHAPERAEPASFGLRPF